METHETRDRLFADSHFWVALFFTGISLLFLAPRLTGYETASILVLYVTVLFFSIAPFAGWALRRGQWLITPITGFIAALTSGLYTTDVTNAGPCPGTTTSRGFPYPWTHQFTPSPANRCPALFLPIQPNPLTGLIFLADMAFYTILGIAFLEWTAAIRNAMKRRREIAAT